MNVQQLLEGSNPYRAVQDDANRLGKKWVRSGLLEGLKTENEKSNMAVMLESQAKQLIIEANTTGVGGGTATFQAGFGENWAGVALPLVRRIFAEIAAKEFVSVQPMSLPSGLIFYLDFKYGTNKANFNSGVDSLYGADPATLKSTLTGSGLYGPGRFGYSLNQFSASVAYVTSAVALSDVNFDSQINTGSLTKVTLAASALTASIDTTGVRAFYISGSGVSFASILPAFTTLNATNGQLVFLTSATVTGPGSGSIQLFYNIQTFDNARGDFEDRTNAPSVPNANSATQIVIPSIDVVLKSEAIVAKTRKLKAQWTPEFAQDLNAYHSIDAEAELTSILSQYISMEIDLEILEMLIENVPASTTAYWSAKNNTFYNPNTGNFETVNLTSTSSFSFYYNAQGEWFQTLGTKLQKVSNTIHQLTLRGGANFMVVSPTISTVLESIPGYASDGDGEKMDYNFGMQKVGSLNSRYKVYKNPYFTENLILLGYKGTQFLECGAVFAPYIPLIMTPLVYDPNTFTPRKGLLTRYAKKMVRPEFYGKIYVHGLETV